MNYGLPASQQHLGNAIYGVLYSYGICGPQCAYGTITPYNRAVVVDREDTFRTDMRLPEKFRISDPDFAGSGFDRGHLWNSADSRRDTTVQMESFLYSNMSPQVPGFNRGVWKNLEVMIRELSCQEDILNVHVWCGPWWEDGNIDFIGDRNGKQTAVPHGFWKTVLSESTKGSLRMWGFSMPNEASTSPVSSFQCCVDDIETLSGIETYPMLRGASSLKHRIAKLWEV